MDRTHARRFCWAIYLSFLVLSAKSAWARVDRDWRSYDDVGGGNGDGWIVAGWFFSLLFAYVFVKERFSQSIRQGVLSVGAILLIFAACRAYPWLVELIPRIGVGLLVVGTLMSLLDGLR